MDTLGYLLALCIALVLLPSNYSQGRQHRQWNSRRSVSSSGKVSKVSKAGTQKASPFSKVLDMLCGVPTAPMNGKLSCKSDARSQVCKGECLPGFQFTNREREIELTCYPDGSWIPTNQFPSCEPICDPTCENGGTCVGHDTCLCQQGFWGSQCETSVSVCDVSRKFSTGAARCNYTAESMMCTVKCSAGTHFQQTPAAYYTCDPYGTWSGDIPSCIADHVDLASSSSMNMHYWQTASISAADKNGLCKTWDQSHFKTFDGRLYSADVQCNYVLAKDCESNSFAVHLHTNNNCGLGDCTPTIAIFVNSNSYKLQKNHGKYELLWDNVPVRIPGSFNSFVIEEITHYLIVKSGLGFTLIWNGKDEIDIEVTLNLANKTCGLCGKFDGNPFNDLQTINGAITENILTFVESWKLNPLQDHCPESKYLEDSCQTSVNVHASAQAFCLKLYDSIFAACNKIVDPEPYVAACMNEFCYCQSSGGHDCGCSSSAAFFHECYRVGGRMKFPWRKPDFCPYECERPLEFNDCGSSCPATCGNPERECVQEWCLEGCFCPKGYLYQNGSCHRQEECPCVFQGRDYTSGSTVSQDCNNCICVNGKWECTKETCEARCSSANDLHYVTFDGRHYDFMGPCSYVLFEHGDVKVEQENVECDGALSQQIGYEPQSATAQSSCIRSVIIKSHGSELKLKPSFQVSLNGKDINRLPIAAPGINAYVASSMFIKVELANGLIVLWDGLARLYLDAPPSLIGQTKGLCGTFTASQRDDFLTPEGDIETSANAFGNKWKTQESCPDIALPGSINDPCITYPDNKQQAFEYCKLIKSFVFEGCFDLVDPEPYFKACLFDMCSCQSSPSDCLCPTIANYGSICNKKGKIINWRNQLPDCAITCPSGQVYSSCGSSCQHSCLDVASNPECPEKCVEGCNCPPGLVLNNEKECILINTCPCLHQNKEFPAGFMDIRERQACECVNAHWDCQPATAEQIKAAENKVLAPATLCLESDNKEATDCESECPVTCANFMHPPTCTTTTCKPGCKCKNGYILDTKSNTCIKAAQCPCHHGEQTYANGDTIKNECNLCVCASGHWQCERTGQDCLEVCSAWGTSHIKTFDGRMYDFSGDCEYTLISGNQGTDEHFTVNVQNMPCGSTQVACFKAVTITLGQDQLMLSKDRPLPSVTAASVFVVHKVGLFVLVHTNIGMTIYWDQNLRVYVKLDSRFAGKVKGLCGDFNGNEMDDFQPPNGGPSIMHVPAFVDNWKVHDTCLDSRPIGDLCRLHPQREGWALQRCGVLNSELFKSCHSTVSVEPYLKSCINDACGCDLGGDCECLCTAIGAYTQECAIHNIEIKWRSQELCPIQCRTCDEYKPCISICPEVTCVTEFLYEELKPGCAREMCVEGCAPHACTANEIFHSANNLTCIPRSECVRQPCKVINGVMYHEGERISDPAVADVCQSCHCQQGQMQCTGKKCVTIILPTVEPRQENLTQLEPECKETGFTGWINSYTPNFKNGGDFELVEELIKLYPEKLCPLKNMESITCRTVGTQQLQGNTGQIVHCNLPEGLVCENKDQTPTPLCYDYEIQIYCNCEKLESPVPWPSVTTITPPPTPKPPVVPKCTAPGWTSWMNSAKPTHRGEYETLITLRKVFSFCDSSQILDVECRDVETKQIYSPATFPNVECSAKRGAVCRNVRQATGRCTDFEIRFYCQCNATDCNYPRGIESGETPDDALSHSSALLYQTASDARLNSPSAWSAERLRPTEWIQVDLQELQEVTGIITQGNPHKPEWVSVYEVDYSEDGFDWHTVFDSLGNKALFTANVDGTTSHTNTFNAVTARYIRIVPQTWVNWISLRFEVLGCNRFVKTSTIAPTVLYISTEITPLPSICNQTGWTEWMNMDSPYDNQDFEITDGRIGDWEVISRLRTFYSFCDEPTAIKCRDVLSGEAAHLTGQRTHCEAASGFHCINSEQEDGLCQNYEVSFYCQCEATTTQIITTNKVEEQRLMVPCTEGTSGYTPWMNSNDPALNPDGDLETINSLQARYDFCEQKYISYMECRVADDETPYNEAGQYGVVCNIDHGLICHHSEQPDKKCKDYEVRFYCMCLKSTTMTTETTAITYSEKVLDLTFPPNFTTVSGTPAPLCNGWTLWYDFDTPFDDTESELFGDIPGFAAYCANPIAVECVDSDTLQSFTGFDLYYAERCTEKGIVCHSDANQRCPDFKIRAYCECLQTSPPDSLLYTQVRPQPCVSGWSNWFDIDNPESGGGDFERVQDLRQHYSFCSNEALINIECQAIAGVIEGEIDFSEIKENAFEADQQVTCNLPTGLECYNSLQTAGRICHDYRVRFLCKCDFVYPLTGLPTLTTPEVPQICNAWTQWFDTDTPYDGIESEIPSNAPNFYKMCQKPVKMECVEVDSEFEHSKFVSDTCDLNGITCTAASSDEECPDFKIRAFCECEGLTTVTIEHPCTEGWTEWFDNDEPETGGGDFETVTDLIDSHRFCKIDQITQVECKATVPGTSDLVNYQNTDDVGVKCSKLVGVACYNEMQPSGQKCENYKVRFYCSCGEHVTRPIPTSPTPTPTPTPTAMCPPGKIWRECAYPCDQMCHSFLHSSLRKGHCSNDERKQCVPGCIKAICEPPYVWRDEDTCVNPNQCTCLTEDGELMGPTQVSTVDCETCHCLHNRLECVERPGCAASTATAPPHIKPNATTPGYVSTTQRNIETEDCWTQWVNVDVPNAFGDFETVAAVRQFYEFCAHPLEIECRVASNKIYSEFAGQNVKCNLPTGFECQNYLNGNEGCFDYEVRFFCPCETTPLPEITQPPPKVECIHGFTDWLSAHTPDSTGEWEQVGMLRKQFSFCNSDKLTSIECRVKSTGQPFDESDDRNVVCNLREGFRCHNADQIYEHNCPDYEVRFWCDCMEETQTTHIITKGTTAPTPKAGTTTESTTKPKVTTETTIEAEVTRTSTEEPFRTVPEISPCYDFIDLLANLPDGSFSASSSISSAQGAAFARYDSETAWTAEKQDRDQYLKIDLGSVQPVYGILAVSHKTKHNWVKSYRIRYSQDGDNFEYYTNYDRTIRIFSGNFEHRRARKHMFEHPILARFLIIEPRSWQGQISMRVQLLGCSSATTVAGIETSPSTIFFPLTFAPECEEPMGLENEQLADNQIVVSSSKGDMYDVSRIRLNTYEGPEGAGAWVADKSNEQQFVQLNFTGPRILTGVTLQGRDKQQQWVTSYTVSYSNDAVTWNSILDNTGEKQVFEGNYDSSTPVTQYFDKSIRAQYLRIEPVTWNNWISLRLEIKGCYEPYPEKVLPETVPPTEVVTHAFQCKKKMGMENGELSDDMIKVSSSRLGPNSDGSRARIHQKETTDSTGGWVAENANDQQYLEIDFRSLRTLEGIVTQGRDETDEWVTKFMVLYSNDGVEWHEALNIQYRNIFTGNSDSSTSKTNIFNNAIDAQYLRIVPLEWHKWISMRLEVLGCFTPYPTSEATTVTAEICTDPMGVESGAVNDLQISVSTSLHGKRSGASRARLDSIEGAETGGWLAAVTNKRQYVQVDFMKPVSLTGVITQGRNGHNEWVKTFKVKQSLNSVDWSDVENANGEMIFIGNDDENTPVTNFFKTTITTRFIRINPITWNNWISMRLEVVGCFGLHETTPSVVVTPPRTLPPATTPSTTIKVTPHVVVTPSRIPLVETTLSTTIPDYCLLYGDWVNLNHPDPLSDGDFEPIDKIIKATGLCSSPIAIECRDSSMQEDFRNTNQKVTCDLSQGLYCANANQPRSGYCYDYEVRIACYICEANTTVTPVPTIPFVNLCPETPLELYASCPSQCYGSDVCDGQNCVNPVDCACYMDGKKYLAGDKWVTEDCKECYCQTNGHSTCTYKMCPPCDSGEVLKLDSSCKCSCEACTAWETQCSSTGECISTSRWCDGVVDCPDDEKDCPTTAPTETTMPSCPEVGIPTCVAGYTLEVQYDEYSCPTYECVLVPVPTTVTPPIPVKAECDMNSNQFKTFDNFEYSYEICDHVLLKDKAEHQFNISVHKECSNDFTQCTKYLVIHQDSHKFILENDLSVTYNNLKYKSSQISKLGHNKNAFSFRTAGSSLMFVSIKYGFEVEWDVWEQAQITVEEKLLNRVTGLCGFYNNKAEDDFTKPDGKIARTSKDFGNSWALGSVARCKPQYCKPDVKAEAHKICSQLLKEPFDSCNIQVNPQMFIKICEKMICLCTAKSNKTVQECKCDAYMMYVDKCQKQSPPVDIVDWRYMHNCAPTCPPGLEWKDCGPACEHTCDNLKDDIKNCEKSGCVPGCFCPQGLVKKDDKCIKKEECQDCICKGYGDPHYFSFDGFYYPFQGNCSYVLARDQPSGNGSHEFEVYTTNEDCLEEPNTTCTVAIMIIYKGHIVHFRVNESASFDGVQLYLSDFPFERHGFVINSTNPPGRTITIKVEAVKLEVRYFELNYGFEIRIPSELYYNKTEGLCGNCNYDPTDDNQARDGDYKNNTDEFALSWLASPPAEFESINDICESKPEEPCIAIQQKERCSKMLLGSEFAACHPLIDPDNYLRACEFDTCHSVDPDASLCRSLTAYTRECAHLGICLQDWRSPTFCPADCPEGMHFEQCGSPCIQTCEQRDQAKLDCFLDPVEGCFCDGNRVMKDGECVDAFTCDTCDEEGHKIGETWQTSSCVSCRCTTNLNVECVSTACPPPPICKNNQYLNTVKAAENECCDKQLCVDQPPVECPEPDIPHCDSGEVAKLKYMDNDCLEYVCECDQSLCPAIMEPVKLGAGEEVQLNTSGCCPFKEVICNTDLCPPPPKCPLHFKLVRQVQFFNEACCPKLKCEPPPSVCIFKPTFTKENGRLVKSYDLPEVIYKLGDTWTDGYCTQCTCEPLRDHYEAHCIQSICQSDSAMDDDYVYETKVVENQCCPALTKVMCKDKDQGRNHTVGDKWSQIGQKCSFYECIKDGNGDIIKNHLQLHCNQTCKINEIYIEPLRISDECCGMCHAVSCLDSAGNVHQVGDSWPSNTHKCYEAVCIDDANDGISILNVNRKCELLPPTCPADKIAKDEDGCCDICTIEPPEEYCQPEKLNGTDTIGLFKVMKNGYLCTNKEPIANFKQCAGKCDSQTIYSADRQDYASSCACCTPAKSTKETVTLECEGNSGSIPFTFQHPTHCQCSPCTSASRN